MLVLSRQISEQIVIGEGPSAATITLTEIDRNKIRLGIEADRSVRIMRRELLITDPPGEPNRV
jgi:carbon storage regulator CsrA